MWGAIVLCCVTMVTNSEATLKMLHIVYRHGDRTPTNDYPNDQIIWPQGLGQLTQLGMQQELLLGRYLRQYADLNDNFLNKSYLVSEVYARSTNTDRTLMSSYTTLAGLYPPQGQQVWNPAFPWQPIPVHTVAPDSDYTGKAPGTVENSRVQLLSSEVPCPQYDHLAEGVMQSPQWHQFTDSIQELNERICRLAGWDKTDVFYLWWTIDAYICQRAHNISLPEYVSEEDYVQMLAIMDRKFNFYFFNQEMKKIRTGVFFNNMIEQMTNYTQHKAVSTQKAFLYSAHDSNLAALMLALQVHDDRIPPYASALFFELRQSGPTASDLTVTVRYKNNTLDNPDTPPHNLTLPGCQTACPLEDFRRILEPMLVTNFEDTCRRNYYSPQGTVIAIGVVVSLVVLAMIALMVRCCVEQRAKVRYHPPVSRQSSHQLPPPVT